MTTTTAVAVPVYGVLCYVQQQSTGTSLVSSVSHSISHSISSSISRQRCYVLLPLLLCTAAVCSAAFLLHYSSSTRTYVQHSSTNSVLLYCCCISILLSKILLALSFSTPWVDSGEVSFHTYHSPPRGGLERYLVHVTL